MPIGWVWSKPAWSGSANMGHQLAGGNSSWCPELESRTTHRAGGVGLGRPGWQAAAPEGGGKVGDEVKERQRTCSGGSRKGSGKAVGGQEGSGGSRKGSILRSAAWPAARHSTAPEISETPML